MSVTGFFHAGVTVSDMERSLTFYRDVLGLEVVSDNRTGGDHAQRIWALPEVRPEAVRAIFLSVPGSDARIELFEFSGIERHPASSRPMDFGAGHFCLYTDDAEALHARAVAAGFTSRSGEVVAIEQGPHAGVRAAYLIDPDGYHVEIIQPPAAQ
jgi:lactoylglutathione lyase